jgi:hypothetical protein
MHKYEKDQMYLDNVYKLCAEYAFWSCILLEK